MQRFKNIVVVVNESSPNAAKSQQYAIERAISLAKANNASLTLLDVVESLNALAEMLVSTILPAKRLQALNIEHRRTELRQLADKYSAEMPIEVEVLVGKPFIETIKAIQREGYDLLIKAAAQDDADGEGIFSGNDMHLIRKCPVPVWVISPTQKAPSQRILALVESNPAQAEAINTSRLVLKLASDLARKNGSELHVVQCWDAPGIDALFHTGRISRDEMDGVSEYLRQRYEVHLASLVGEFDFDGITQHTHLLRGASEYLIPSKVRQDEIGLVIGGTVSETSTKGLLMDTSAEGMLSRLHCSVMAIKPEGFHSPIEASPSDVAPAAAPEAKGDDIDDIIRKDAGQSA